MAAPCDYCCASRRNCLTLPEYIYISCPAPAAVEAGKRVKEEGGLASGCHLSFVIFSFFDQAMSTNCEANAWRFLAACASRVFTFSCTRTSWRLPPPADTPHPHPLSPSLLWSSSCYAATLNLNSICCRFNIFLLRLSACVPVFLFLPRALSLLSSPLFAPLLFSPSLLARL